MKGFTLIELVVTVSIVGILAAALLPLGQLSVKRMKEAELRAALREIRTALDAYKKATDEGRVEKIAETAGYPKSLDILVAGVPDMRDPKKRLLRFLRRIPRDPMNPDLEASPQETWGIRSYDSERDAPQGGDDVFDVFSLSHETGLNGVAYHEW
jgi:general secretion pathway protein G